MKIDADADWETLLFSASRVSRIVPDSIFPDTNEPEPEEARRRFAAALADLERVAGWMPTPAGRLPVGDGRFDGVETTIRDRTRFGPLETTVEVGPWGEIEVPTLAEILRIKSWFVLSRNAARDYVDAAALAKRIGHEAAVRALSTPDILYPQSNGASALQQLLRQLAEPRPFDLVDPAKYGWTHTVQRCRSLAAGIMLSLKSNLAFSASPGAEP